MDFLEFMRWTGEEYDGEAVERVPKRRLADLQNPMENNTDAQFMERYRFTKQGVHDFIAIIQHDFRHSRKGVALPMLHKMLIFLRFTSSGSFQLLSADLEGISQPTVSNAIKEVSKVIVGNIGTFIQWPHLNVHSVKEEFFAIASFPDVMGAIGCTHVGIQNPGGENAKRYRNQKGYFSINCQAVCDARLIFTNIYAKWYGSTRDAKVFRNSALCGYLENQSASNQLLLGDQGYPLTNYLMTPLRNPSREPEMLYNKSHKKTRLTIERAFCVLKRVFSCLKTRIRLKVDTTLHVIPACVCMYNFLRQRGMIDPSFDDFTDDEMDSSGFMPQDKRTDCAEASEIRQQLIRLHFT